MHIYWFQQRSYELRGRNSAYYSHKTNILDFDDGDDRVFQKLCIKLKYINMRPKRSTVLKWWSF